MTLAKTWVHANWNDNPLWQDEDILQESKTFTDTFNQTFAWDIAAIAPEGQYNINFTGHPADESITSFCANIQMYLN